ncbi:hypothetical protein LX36DRAFT_381568 [Colletotrichum falcatum]|nr:hypothetical protein LX36DRAFT_381568 [Colletotrichum falcatum]
MLRFLVAAFHQVTWPRSGWISSNDLTPVCLRKGTPHSSPVALPPSWLANLLATSLSLVASSSLCQLRARTGRQWPAIMDMLTPDVEWLVTKLTYPTSDLTAV